MTAETCTGGAGSLDGGLSQLAAQFSQLDLPRAAALEAYAAFVGAESVGEGAPPSGATTVGPGLWVQGGRPERAAAAAPLLRIVLDRFDAVDDARATWRRCGALCFDGLAVLIDGSFVDANGALCALLGRSREDLRGCSFESVVVPERREQVRGGLAAGRLVAHQMELVSASGTVVPVALRIRPCTVRRRPAWLVAVRDRRDAVEAERRARELDAHAAAERARHARLLSALGHELRTPMDGILGMLDLLLAGRLAPDQRQRGCVVRESAAHLTTVLDDLVDLASARDKGLSLHRAPTVLREVLVGALASLRRTAARAGVALRLELAPELASTWALDGRRVQQLLVNLLSHAVRHTSAGVVRLSARPCSGGLRLEVSRSGTVLSRVERELVGRGPGWEGGGAGLGLAICHELVQLMDGQVTAHIEALGAVGLRVELPVEPVPQRLPRGCRVALVGPVPPELAAALVSRGSTVRRLSPTSQDPASQGPAGQVAVGEELRAWGPDLVYWAARRPQPGPWISTSSRAWPGQPGLRVLPEHVTAEELLMVALPPELESAPVSVPEARTLSVLVVEDNVISQQVVGEMLRKAGHEVEVVANGKLGVEAALRGRPDLILMDVQMPVMDGLEAAAALRQAQCGAPIVALTAHATPEDRLACERAGMDGYLAKPVRVAQLNTVLTGLGAQLPQLATG